MNKFTVDIIVHKTAMIVALPKVVKIPSPFFFFRVIPAPRNPLLESRSTLEQIIVVIPFFEIR